MNKAVFLKLLKKTQERSIAVDEQIGVDEDLKGFSTNMVNITAGKTRYDRRLLVQHVEPQEDYVRIRINVEKSVLGCLANQPLTSVDLVLPYSSILGVLEYTIEYPKGSIPYCDIVVHEALISRFMPDDNETRV